MTYSYTTLWDVTRLRLGWSHEQAAVLGMVVSLSSSMVVLKTLIDRGELRSVHGRILTGILLVQDLTFIPMIAILPALSGDGGLNLSDLGFCILKAAAVLGLMALLDGKAIPWLLSQVAYLGSREIFIMAVVAITFATAAITEATGLSAALGAFVASLLLSESEFGQRALSEVVPLRDTFSALFFVSLGMLADPVFLIDNFGTVLVVVAVVMAARFLLTAALTRGFGYLPYTAILVGLGMVQVGEFSFILADSASDLGAIDQDFLSLIVVSAFLTMALTPWVMTSGARAVARLSRRVDFLRPYRLREAEAADLGLRRRNHVVICGLGRVGSLVAQALEEHQVPFIAIDLDPRVVARSRSGGHAAVYGSSSSETVLMAARVNLARLMVITTSDPGSAWLTAQHSIGMNSDLDIVARVRSREEGERLQRLGVREVVWPEMEAGLEILRHSLDRYRTDPREVDRLVNRLRQHLSFEPPADTEGTGQIDDRDKLSNPPQPRPDGQ